MKLEIPDDPDALNLQLAVHMLQMDSERKTEEAAVEDKTEEDQSPHVLPSNVKRFTWEREKVIILLEA